MRQDVYRAAFDEANAELAEILNKFDQLRQRKERIEKVVEMLKPMAGAEGSMESVPMMMEQAPAVSEPEPQVPELVAVGVHEEAEQTAEPVQNHAETTADPFQRRIDSALGLSGGLRDSREFGRRFAGTFQRG
jgi:thioredoxin-like negative regulator of GroEL